MRSRIYRRFFAIFLLLAMMAGLLLGGCRPESEAGKGFRFPLDAEPRQLDPQAAVDKSSVTVVAALFEGLTRLDEEGKAVPAAADWTLSEDGLTYTFRLKTSKWSNGEPVTADDFVFGMQRAISPDGRAELAEQLFDIAGAEAIRRGKQAVDTLGVTAQDGQTLTITLTTPNETFPEKLAGTPFMPCNRAFFEACGGRYGLETDYLLSNGPFFLKAWNHDANLLLEKHEDYHAADEILPAAVRYVIGEPDDPLAALTSGSLDAVELRATSAVSGVRLVELEDTIDYIWLNNTVSPLSEASVRRALRDALEWDVIAGRLDTAFARPAEGYVSPEAVVGSGETYRREENALPLKTDVARAQENWAAGMRALELAETPVLTVLCAEDADSVDVAQYVVQSWQKNLSLYFHIEPLPADQLATRVRVGNYQIAICPATAGGASALDALSMFAGSSAAGNWSRFEETAFTEACSAAAGGGVQRGEAEALELSLNEQCPAIPLAFRRRCFGLPETVSGVVLRPFDGGAFGAALDFRAAGKREE